MADELFEKKAERRAPTQPHVEDVAARLKVLEERYANLSRREQLAEQNMLHFERDLKADLRAIQKRLLESRRHTTEVRESLETIQGQVANTAPKHELRAIEAYLNLIQPLEFMTREEAKKLLEEYK
ncbi:hypothetical protein GOV10_00050 [Candidatus Woesearchaeota archaeon]|nr:hypothetical protein [Candidatus Woesearchaeota archaeon]